MTLLGNWLARTWCQRGLAACLLWPLSLVYGLLSDLHRRLYRFGIFEPVSCAAPVVVVGNVVVGGGGKTPLVIALAKHWQQRGVLVGVVSRGYGRHGKSCLEVLENTPLAESGDEPALILRALAAPVFIAKKRTDAVNALLAKYPATQVIISDDGLQHHRMARDIEIIVFDDRGIGNGWLLPAGPLRERWRGQRSHALVLHTGQSPACICASGPSGSSAPYGFASARCLAAYAFDLQGRKTLLSSLQGQRLTALAGIANPDGFFDMLTAEGLALVQTIRLPDHFDFSGYTLPVLPNAIVLCTEKDAIKLFKLPISKACRLLVVPLEFSPEPAFIKAVDALLAPLLAAAGSAFDGAAIDSHKAEGDAIYKNASQLTLQHGAKNGHETA